MDIWRSLLRSFKKLRFWLIAITVVITVFKLLIIPHPWPDLPAEECIDRLPETGGCGFVFDEAHYVPAARKMLIGQAANNEHPPLSKALIMLGILIFGDNPYGWRTFITLCGAACVYLVGLIAYELSGSRKLSIIASILFGFDVTSFNIGSIAILDAPALMFSLLGTLFLLRHRFIASGISLGLALLSKVSAFLIVISLMLYIFFKNVHESKKDLRFALRKWIRIVELVVFTAAVIMIVGLAIYDYAYGAYKTPFEHLAFMWNYHTILTFDPQEMYKVDMPLTWILPMMQFPRSPLYVVEVIVNSKKYHPIAYYVMQTPLWWTGWLVIVSLLYFTYLKLRSGDFPKMEIFVTLWFATNYLVYFPLAYVFHRWVYPFYFCMTVPVIAMGLPTIFIDDRKFEYVLYAATLVQVVWFLVFFPVKPEWYSDLLLLFGLPA
ncbi:MAG: phospholipid carrier-dependent glycosyltransferase [Nitrososphaerota archaeon]